MNEEPGWLYTSASTQLSWVAMPRKRPCWRCRFHLRWRGRRHFQCRPLTDPALPRLEDYL
jgi:hypothetical protein